MHSFHYQLHTTHTLSPQHNWPKSCATYSSQRSALKTNASRPVLTVNWIRSILPYLEDAYGGPDEPRLHGFTQFQRR